MYIIYGRCFVRYHVQPPSATHDCAISREYYTRILIVALPKIES